MCSPYQCYDRGESGSKHSEIPTPTSWQEALSGSHAPEWLEAMVKECKGLESTQTFVKTERPHGVNIVKCKWVFRVKRTETGAPIFKARLVAKGFSQKKGVDYHQIWAPTARQATARVILHLAAHLNWEIHAMDVDQAFLHGDLKETIYMEIPEGIPEHRSASAGDVWQLKRPLYGLKQAPREWHAKLKGVLLQMGFKPSTADPSLFLGHTSAGSWILVYVDDLLIMAPTMQDLESIKADLKSHFPMKDLGPVTTYLGMQITRDREQRHIMLHQQRQIEHILERFQDCDVKECDTPLMQNHELTAARADEESCPEQERYPELVGSLMYIMVCTRPDLAHPLSVLGRYVAPGKHKARHWKAALRALGYLKKTQGQKLVLGGAKVQLEGYTDASWADNRDNRRSSQGYCFTLGSGMVSWKGTQSPAVALSSCEAELYGCAAAAQELLWLKRLLADLGVPASTPTLWCDNRSTVLLTQDPVFTARSKHIEARYYFIRELVSQKALQTVHIAGTDNPADVFTKALPQDKLQKCLQQLGVT